MTITLNGSSLTVEKLVAIARINEEMELAPEALERIKICRAVREDKGAITSAKNIAKIVEGSDLTTGKMKTKVQDAYSMRSPPQVIGAARDAIAYARSQVEIDIVSGFDDPVQFDYN